MNRLSLATLRELQRERISYAFDLEELGRSAEAALVWSIADSITTVIESRLVAQAGVRRSA